MAADVAAFLHHFHEGDLRALLAEKNATQLAVFHGAIASFGYSMDAVGCTLHFTSPWGVREHFIGALVHRSPLDEVGVDTMFSLRHGAGCGQEIVDRAWAQLRSSGDGLESAPASPWTDFVPNAWDYRTPLSSVPGLCRQDMVDRAIALIQGVRLQATTAFAAARRVRRI